MTTVEVSPDALQNVKASLRTFQAATDGLASRLNSASEACIDSCTAIMDRVSGEIHALEMDMAQLDAKIHSLDELIGGKERDRARLLGQLPRLEDDLRSTEQLVSELTQQMRALQAQLSSTDDPEQKQSLLAQIEQVSHQLRSAEQRSSQLRQEILNAKQRISSLEHEISSLGTDRSRLVAERNQKARRLAKTRRRHEDLDAAFKASQTELRTMTAAAKSFESSAASALTRGMGSIEKCIAKVDEYLATDL